MTYFSGWGLFLVGLAHAGAVFATANTVAEDERGASVVSRCAIPRIATRAHARHECDNRLPRTHDNYYVDICTGLLDERQPMTTSEQFAARTTFDRGRPEWATQPTADGPGMRGILPWGCEAVSGAPPQTVPLQPPPQLASAIAALSVGHGEYSGKMIGSAILISPTVLLTARHVLYDEKVGETRSDLTHAIFGFFNSDIYAPPSHEALNTSRLFKNTDGYPTILAASRKLDFALVELEQSSGAMPIPIPKRGASAGHAGPMVLGYTDNPFFPRGLIVSTHGDWRPAPPGLSGNDTARYDLFYNVNTAKGFSGGPVFDTSHRLRGMHLRAFPGDDLRDSKKLMDFSRPNGGVSVDAIFTCLAASFTSKQLEDMLGSKDSAAAIASYRDFAKGKPLSCDANEPSQALTVGLETPVATAATAPRESICHRNRKTDADKKVLTSWCHVDLGHKRAQDLLPKPWRGWRPAIGALVGKDSKNVDKLLGTAVLIGADLVVTAGHVVPIPDSMETQDVRFVLGYQPENLLGAPPEACVYKRKVSRPMLAASARSLRDFAVLRLEQRIELSLQATDCNWTLLPPRALPPAVNTKAFAIGHFVDERVAHNLSLFYAGEFMGVNRWSKDGGGSVNVDYGLGTQPGLSGGAVFDEDFNWVALHQRTLSRAYNEVDTRWHPYGFWMYGDNRAECLAKGSDPSGVELTYCWPAQGTLMSDIAIDTARAMGSEWMCSELPTWIPLLALQARYSCDEAVRAIAGDAARVSGPTD